MIITGTACLFMLLAAATGDAAKGAAPDRAWLEAARRKPAGVAPGPERPGPPVRIAGREYRSLDEYLAFLRDYAAPIDRPWYREVRPGLYRLETGNLRNGAPARHFTREQLERRFGFRR